MVEAIVSVWKHKKLGYEAHIKWEGWKDSDNTWELLGNLYEDWGVKKTDVYSFFHDHEIDITKCDHFDFTKMQPKIKNISTKKNESNVKKNTEKPNTLGLCNKSHKVMDGNLKMESNGSYAKAGYFLFEQKCVKCTVVFVPSGESKLNEQFKVSMSSPCYVCTSMNCKYYLCDFCYKDEILDDEDSGRRRTRKVVK